MALVDASKAFIHKCFHPPNPVVKMRWDCGTCAKQCSSFSDLCTHISIWHAKGVIIACGIGGCQQSFHTASAFRSHGYRNHEDTIVAAATNNDGAQCIPNHLEPENDRCQMDIDEVTISNSDTNIVNAADFSGLDDDDGIDTAVTQLLPNSQNGSSRPMSLPQIHQVTSDAITDMFLKIRETNALPNSTTRNIFTEFSMLFQGFYTFLKDAGAINESHVHSLNDHYFSSLFGDVSTDWKVLEHLKKHPYFVPPVTRKLTDDFSIEHVSVSDTLKALFLNDDMCAEVLDYLGKQPNPTVLTDFKDGTEGYNISNADANCDFVIPIIFYTDEFEVCNPIGAARIKHKISAVYYTLACLPPRLRSKRKYIFLSALIPDEARKSLGYKTTLKPIIDELRDIYHNPVTLNNGKQVCVKLVAFCGDNLSAHALGGFQGSFSSGYVCRFCHCHYGEVASKFMERDFVLRSPTSIQNDLEHIQGDRQTNGLKSKSILFDLEYNNFHLADLLLPDILHDFLESILVKVICVVLRILKLEGLLTIATINRLISRFRYRLNGTGLNCYDIELNNTNLNEEKLKGTASQKWCLLIHLPLMLNDMDVSMDHDAWLLMLKCREIGEILLSHSIPKHKLEYLSYLIHEHHQLFRQLAPGSMTPKFHYLVHYPHLISKFGPPVRYWTMRFEGKHQQHKDLARKLKNFKNICKTLTNRSQILQAVNLSSSTMFGEDGVISGPGETMTLSDIDESVCSSMKECAGLGFFEDETVFSASWVEVNGMKYQKGCILITGIVQEDIPLFGKIEFIVNIRSQWYLGGVEIIPDTFDARTWSYKCHATTQHVFQRLNSLYCGSPALSYNLNGTLHVILIALPSKY